MTGNEQDDEQVEDLGRLSFRTAGGCGCWPNA
jgi:hypothetical protein